MIIRFLMEKDSGLERIISLQVKGIINPGPTLLDMLIEDPSVPMIDKPAIDNGSKHRFVEEIARGVCMILADRLEGDEQAKREALHYEIIEEGWDRKA